MTTASRYAAGLLAAALPLTHAHAATQFAYSAGTGASTSSLVVDFSESGGDAYVFAYRYDGVKTGLDLVQELDAAGGLELFSTQFSFGLAIDGFGFDGNAQDLPFGRSDLRSWTYWLDGGAQDSDFDGSFTLDEAVAAGAYTFAGVGAGGRLLADGSVDGWVVAVDPFGNPAGRRTPASVPEPASLALAGLALLAVAHRRRTR